MPQAASRGARRSSRTRCASARGRRPRAPAAIVRSIETRAVRPAAGASPASASQAACDTSAGAPRMDGDVLERPQLARQVLDVHAGPAVDLRRVLAGHHRDLHCGRPACPSGSRRRRPSETWKRSRSAAGSTPISTPSRIVDVLVQDRPPHDRAAADLDARARGSSPPRANRSAGARVARGSSGAPYRPRSPRPRTPSSRPRARGGPPRRRRTSPAG